MNILIMIDRAEGREGSFVGVEGGGRGRKEEGRTVFF